jgi:hypothetical protein
VLAHVSDSSSDEVQGFRLASSSARPSWVEGSATRPSLTHTLSSVPPPRSAGWSDGPGKGNAANN